MSDRIRLSGTTVNAPDALALAEFYAELTGGVAKGNEHWATVSGPNGVHRLPAGRRLPPTGVARGRRTHADAPRLLRRRPRGDRSARRAAGATRLDFQPNSDHCFVYADPAGHPFCLSTWDLS